MAQGAPSHTPGLTSSQAPDSGKTMSSGDGFKLKAELRLFMVKAPSALQAVSPYVPQSLSTQQHTWFLFLLHESCGVTENSEI